MISLFCCDFILFLLLLSYIIDCTVFIYSAINNVCVYVYVHLSHIPRNKAYLLTYLLTSETTATTGWPGEAACP